MRFYKLHLRMGPRSCLDQVTLTNVDFSGPDYIGEVRLGNLTL